MSQLQPYQHKSINHQLIDLPVGKAVCVGRNYAEHAKELGNEVPDSPLLFIKPSTSFVSLQPSFSIPSGQGSVHHELEIALLVSQPARDVSVDDALNYISHVGLGLDLTLRDVQTQLKQKAHPWERAKAFDGACPLSPWLEKSQVGDLADIQITLKKNHQVQQDGNSQEMIHSMAQLVSYMSSCFTLLPGDVILTGTPAGVSELKQGDELELILNNGLAAFKTKVN